MKFLQWRWAVDRTLKGRHAPFTSRNIDSAVLRAAFNAGDSPVSFALATIADDLAVRAVRRAGSVDTGLGECVRCGSRYLRHETRHERRGVGVAGMILFLICIVTSCLLPLVACLLAVPATILLIFDLQTVPVQYRVCNGCGFWTRFG